MNPQKLTQKRELFLERTDKIIPRFDESLLNGPRQQSVRVNTLKSSLTFSKPIAWAPNCYWYTGDKSVVTHSKEFENGHIYVQNAASFIPPLLLDPQPGERVLDMCAAPGGKASHIAMLANNQAELWVNDNSRTRLTKMTGNFQRLGIKPHNTTLFGISHLKRRLPAAYFDKILLDAPCSGEGMMDLTRPKDFVYWSVAQIKRLQSLQKQALTAAWELLKPGGLLVYSTCTMAPEENEAVIDYFLRKHPAATLVPIALSLPNRMAALTSWNTKNFVSDLAPCLRLAPSKEVEAFFVAVVRKGE